MGEQRKAPLKDAVYRSLGGLFRGTAAYTAWLEARGRTPSSSERDVAGSAPADIALADFPPASGDWEWQPYEAVKQRARELYQEERSGWRPVPRNLISIDPAALQQAAARINLPDPGAAPDVSVIVPVHGQLRYTIECLLSVARAGAAERTFEVIVADDASPDETVATLESVSNLRLHRQQRNVGFLRNCNSAASSARGRFLVFLNNDAQVSPGWLDAMANVFVDRPKVGAVGPRIVYPDGVLQEAGNRVRRDGSVEMIGLNGRPEDPRWSYERDVDYVSGACLMIERLLFEELGGFDESLAPAYGEDVELGLRLLERGRRSVYTPAAEIAHHLSVTSNALPNDFKVGAITRNLQRITERHAETLDRLDDVRLISFYLPQFHPFEQNELWWGPGFTEWTNVARARPNWAGHYQPRMPADLGYYDLRVPEVLDKQSALASRYGIDAFCYYYYWFGGQRLLDRPLEPLLDPARDAHPFCLCWANENWTRRWDGREQDVLMAQQHSARDDLAVIRDMARYVEHPAYLRVAGRPLILVYRVDLFRDFARTAERWRTECRKIGIGEIHLAMVESFAFAGSSSDPATFGCDAAVEFPAHYIPNTVSPPGGMLNRNFSGLVADYSETAARKMVRPHPGYKLYRGIMPGWDNTARRQNNPFVLDNATPGAFQAWLEAVIEDTKRDLHGDDRLVFINAWNEWAEGAYLEPDLRFGHGFLEAVRNARETSRLARSEWS